MSFSTRKLSNPVQRVRFAGRVSSTAYGPEQINGGIAPTAGLAAFGLRFR